MRFARAFAQRLGMRPFEIDDEHRAAYHAAASIASNFLVTLQESAAELLGATGAEDARELLSPLVLRTAANWSERGPDALTGPIARGDEATVERHVEALRERALKVEAARAAESGAGEGTASDLGAADEQDRGGLDANWLAAWVLAVAFVVFAVIGFVTALGWIVPG